MKQLSLWKNPDRCHGSHRGKRKTARPIACKRPMHLVMRSERACGNWNMLRHAKQIEAQLKRVAHRFGVEVLRFQNVGNHLHLAVQPRSRSAFQNFLRVFTQAVAFLVTKTRKGKPIGKFWDGLAYSRIVEWGRDWRNLVRYFEKNRLEARGIPRDVVDFVFTLNES